MLRFPTRSSVTILRQDRQNPLAEAFRFDAVFTMKETNPGQVFRHPQQLGLEGITDDVYLDTPSFQLQGVVGENPVSFLPGDGGFGLNTGVRAQSLYDQLLDLRRDKVPLTVLCSWRPPLSNRWIESIDAEKSVAGGNTISLSVTFTKLRLAVTQVVPGQQDSDVLLLAQQTVDISSNPTQF